jgi:hypothetical protein
MTNTRNSNAANVDLGNLMLRLNAQAMEIIRLRQINVAQAERLENLVAGKEEEGIETDFCEACSASYVVGDGIRRPVVWFKEPVEGLPGMPTSCYSACVSCVSKHGWEDRALQC